MKDYSRIVLRGAGLALALVVANFCLAQEKQEPLFAVSPDHTNGIYAVGDTVHWRIAGTGSHGPAQAHYVLLKGELTKLAEGDVTLTNGAATLDSKFDSPGQLMLEARNGTNKTGRALAGAVAGMDEIKTSAARPADFDAFWESKLKELAAVPANPQLESVATGRTNVLYWKITMDNIRGAHIHGQLARPAREGKYPAVLVVQWAGVYPLERQWVTGRASGGWLALNIQAHDMAIDATEKDAKVPGDYPMVGNDDRETSYFLRMYLSCYRAVEYLRGRPDWDGKTLVVMGASQGGMQTLMIAGLNPGVTAALALIPAGSDMLGPEAGRKGGWPQWYDRTWGGKDAKKVHEASRYYDVCNFAPLIKCPVLIGFGLIDETCPPEGVLATYNVIKSPKEKVVLPKANHGEVNGSHRAFYRVESDWLTALREGKAPPVGKGD